MDDPYPWLIEQIDNDPRPHSDAKRELADLHQPRIDAFGQMVCDRCSWTHSEIVGETVGCYAPCDYLLLLTLSYTDRPGFQPEWIPDGDG